MCEPIDGQRWQLIASELGSFQFRNVATAFNLDIQFSSSDSGTLAVLFSPHELYNQRFVLRERIGSAFEVSPLHARLQCLTLRDSLVAIWPCNIDDAGQAWSPLAESCQ
jgi:hypothetical protein